MSGHGAITHMPDGSVGEVVRHDMKLLAAELISNGLAMYALLLMGVPQYLTGGNPSHAMLAAKLSAMFSGVNEAKRWLARMGLQLPAAMYGGTSGHLY